MEFDFYDINIVSHPIEKEEVIIKNISLKCSYTELIWLVNEFSQRDDKQMIFETEVV